MPDRLRFALVQTTPIAVRGVAAPVSVDVPFARRPKVLVGGQEAQRLGRNRYALPGVDGKPVEGTVKATLVDPYPRLTVDGQTYLTGPKVPIGLQIVAALPVVLFVGGLLGIVLALLGVFANVTVLRTTMATAGKVGLVLGITVVTVLVYTLLVVAIVSSGSS